MDAALGAMASQLAAGEMEKFAEGIANILGDNPDAKQLIANLVSNAISSGLGIMVGGESGGNLASSMDRNNRQLHFTEQELLRKLATDKNGVIDEEKLKRLEDAALVLVYGFMEYPPDSDEYKEYLDRYIYALGNYQEEINYLKNYQSQEISGNYALFFNPGEGYYFKYTMDQLEMDLSLATSKPITLADAGSTVAELLFNYETICEYAKLYETGGTLEKALSVFVIAASAADGVSNLVPLKGIAGSLLKSLAKDLGQETAEAFSKQLGQEGFEQLAKELGEDGIELLGKGLTKESAELIMQYIPKETLDKIVKESAEKGTADLSNAIADHIAENAIENSSRLVPGGGLMAHEVGGGHLIARHVGQTEEALLARLAKDPSIPAASTFTDRVTAEKVISEAIDAKDDEIAKWLNGSSGKRLVLNHTSNIPTGISISQGAKNALNVNGVRVVLVRDPAMKEGYKILTGYPQ